MNGQGCVTSALTGSPQSCLGPGQGRVDVAWAAEPLFSSARIAAAASFVFILRKVIFFKGAPLLKERVGTKGLSQS